MFLIKLILRLFGWKEKPRHVPKYTLEQLYRKARGSREPTLVKYVLRRVEKEWGDGKKYHQLYRHYHIITGKYFEAKSNGEPEDELDGYIYKMLFDREDGGDDE